MNVNILNRNPPASNPMEAHITCRRRALTSAIASLLLEMGIDCAEKQVMESLTELLQSCKYHVYLKILMSKRLSHVLCFIFYLN